MSKRIYLKSIDGVVIMMSKHFYLYGYNNRAETVQKT